MITTQCQRCICLAVISVIQTARFCVFFYLFLQRIVSSVGNSGSAHLSFAFNDAEYEYFAMSTSTALPFSFAAKRRFVHFQDATERCRQPLVICQHRTNRSVETLRGLQRTEDTKASAIDGNPQYEIFQQLPLCF